MGSFSEEKVKEVNCMVIKGDMTFEEDYHLVYIDVEI